MRVSELMEQQTKGTYAGARFDTATNKALHKYMSDNNIPNAIRPDKLHTTILYSRKYCPNYKPLGKLSTPWTAKPLEFVIWKTNASGGSENNSPQTNCLVLKLDCPELENRHKALMKEHGATYDFATYEPHVTLSYDIGDIDIDKLPNIFDSVKHINIVEEYGEDLDLNWAQTKGVKKGG